MPDQPCDRRGLEARAVVVDPDRYLRAWRRTDRQRVVGPVLELDRANLQVDRRLADGRFDRVVLEDQQALEQRLTVRHLAPRLGLDQRGIFVLAQLGLLRLE